MGVENVKKLEIAEKCEINKYIYILIAYTFGNDLKQRGGQHGRHKLVRACAIPDTLTSEQPR